jgi:hypothetical protein
LWPAVEPGDDRRMSRSEEADVLRILSQYKRLVLLGKARIPLAEARRLVGPDCAYHLYFRHQAAAARRQARRKRGTRAR